MPERSRTFLAGQGLSHHRGHPTRRDREFPSRRMGSSGVAWERMRCGLNGCLHGTKGDMVPARQAMVLAAGPRGKRWY